MKKSQKKKIDTTIRPFHLAIPSSNIIKLSKWYIETLNCKMGRTSKDWIDLNFYGHQLVLHYDQKIKNTSSINVVDSKNIPTRHFGIILENSQWENLRNTLVEKKIQFIIKPHIRFQGKKGEQKTMFFLDPENNALEFKSFKNNNMIFDT